MICYVSAASRRFSFALDNLLTNERKRRHMGTQTYFLVGISFTVANHDGIYAHAGGDLGGAFCDPLGRHCRHGTLISIEAAADERPPRERSTQKMGNFPVFADLLAKKRR